MTGICYIPLPDDYEQLAHVGLLNLLAGRNTRRPVSGGNQEGSMLEPAYDDDEQSTREGAFRVTLEVLHDLRMRLFELIESYEHSDSLDTDTLETLLSLWHDLFDSVAARESYIFMPQEVAEQPWLDQPKLLELRDSLRSLEEMLLAQQPANAVNGAIHHLENSLWDSLWSAKRTKHDYLTPSQRVELSKLIDLTSSQLTSLKSRRSLRNLQQQAEGAVADAEASASAANSAADASKTAAGITGEAKMSSFYSDLAAEETAAANTFRRLTVTLAFTAAASTALFILGPALGIGWLDIEAGDYVHLIQRAVFVAGVFGLAGYFARQAHQHRSMANWASALSVQLRTFEAYLSAVESADVRDELRKSFATRVFGDHPAMKGEPSVTPSAAAMDTAVGWAAKLTSGGGK